MSGVDKTSCYFATVPGGAAEMSVLAMKYNGNVPAVAISQSLRVSTLVLVIPAVLTYTGFADLDRTAVDMLPPFVTEKFLILMATTLAGALLFVKLRLQNPWMMGSLITSAVVAANGITLSRVPVETIDVAQVMLGMALGSRFEREFFLRYKLFIPYALFNGFFLMVACAGVAVVVAAASGLPLGSVLLALAPGGIGEMAITAKILELGVATVTAFQFVRITAANFSPPLVFPLIRKLNNRRLARGR
jgi:membrane AbrB-like protein